MRRSRVTWHCWGTFCSLKFVPISAGGLILSVYCCPKKTTESVYACRFVGHAPHFFDEGTNYIIFLILALVTVPIFGERRGIRLIRYSVCHISAVPFEISSGPQFTFLWCHSHKHKPTAVLNSVNLAYSEPIQCRTHGWLINFS